MPHDAPYGADHRRRREQALPAAYNTPCPRCGELMLKGQTLDFGHSLDRTFDAQSKADQMEHADYRDCPAGGNRAAGGRLGRDITKLAPSRQW